jgi:hypothetical protein
MSDEPDLNRELLSKLLIQPGSMVEFYQDELCCKVAAIEFDENEYSPDEDEVFYAPESKKWTPNRRMKMSRCTHQHPFYNINKTQIQLKVYQQNE